jgi:hypothetical protein
MKKTIIALFVALVATVAVKAQQISVVYGGETSLFSTLQEAIEGAQSGSVIYLPGGGFPIADEVKITKKLTIIGIGHKVKSENADGYTTITGNLFFDKGSDNSAVMGTYMTGSVYIGNDGNQVDGVLVRYCNLNSVQVNNSKCLGTEVNQNYIRSMCSFSRARAEFTNNIAWGVGYLYDGIISYNTFISSGTYQYAIYYCNNCSITNNVLNDRTSYNDCLFDQNLMYCSFGENEDNIRISDWGNLFVKNVGISPNSDFHLKGDYAKYNNTCGVYGGGSGFSDTALPPVPYIVAKQIPQQTDANGKLNIKVRVNAGQ